MKLEKISGGNSFGIDYHLSVILYPIPFMIQRPYMTQHSFTPMPLPLYLIRLYFMIVYIFIVMTQQLL